MSSAEEELYSDGNDNAGNADNAKTTKKTKSKKQRISKKTKTTRKGNPLLANLSKETSEEEKIIFDTSDDAKTEKEQKKAQDVWADFLADTEEKKEPVSVKRKSNSWASLLGNKKAKSSTSQSSQKGMIFKQYS